MPYIRSLQICTVMPRKVFITVSSTEIYHAARVAPEQMQSRLRMTGPNEWHEAEASLITTMGKLAVLHGMTMASSALPGGRADDLGPIIAPFPIVRTSTDIGSWQHAGVIGNIAFLGCHTQAVSSCQVSDLS